MKKTISLIAAPTGIQPGGYVPKAYADRISAKTPSATVEVQKTEEVLTVILEWENKHPVKSIDGDVQAFVDSAAILAPKKVNTVWMTMGGPDSPINGAFWRADNKMPIQITAAGLGSVERSEAPADWQVNASWQNNIWRVQFVLANWSAALSTEQFAVAIWKGHDAERGGLKSVSSDWININ